MEGHATPDCPDVQEELPLRLEGPLPLDHERGRARVQPPGDDPTKLFRRRILAPRRSADLTFSRPPDQPGANVIKHFLFVIDEFS